MEFFFYLLFFFSAHQPSFLASLMFFASVHGAFFRHFASQYHAIIGSWHSLCRVGTYSFKNIYVITRACNRAG